MRMIAGIFDSEKEQKVRFWWVKDFENFAIGDYAIVESKGGYGLVRIIADVFTSENFAHHLTSNYRAKKVIKTENILALNRALEDLDIE